MFSISCWSRKQIFQICLASWVQWDSLCCCRIWKRDFFVKTSLVFQSEFCLSISLLGRISFISSRENFYKSDLYYSYKILKSKKIHTNTVSYSLFVILSILQDKPNFFVNIFDLFFCDRRNCIFSFFQYFDNFFITYFTIFFLDWS